MRIGVVLSGPGIAGARAAIADVNAAGGIGGRPAELRVGSEGSTTIARLALAVAESLANDRGVIAVVGHANSSASISAAQIYNERGLVQLAPTSSAPRLTSAGRFTFRLVASDLHQARFLASQVARGPTPPRIALIYVNDDYGRPLYLELRSRLADAHVPIVYERPYLETQPFDEPAVAARRIVDARADLLVWLGRQPQLRDLLPSLRKLAPRLPILGSDGLDGVITAANAGGRFTGLRHVCFVDVSAPGEAMAHVRQAYRAISTAPFTAESALAYDAVMLLATAAREAGATRGAVREYLASLGRTRLAYAGATGAIAFDETGDRSPAYCLVEITATGPRVVTPAAAP